MSCLLVTIVTFWFNFDQLKGHKSPNDEVYKYKKKKQQDIVSEVSSNSQNETTY